MGDWHCKTDLTALNEMEKWERKSEAMWEFDFQGVGLASLFLGQAISPLS